MHTYVCIICENCDFQSLSSDACIHWCCFLDSNNDLLNYYMKVTSKYTVHALMFAGCIVLEVSIDLATFCFISMKG